MKGLLRCCSSSAPSFSLASCLFQHKYCTQLPGPVCAFKRKKDVSRYQQSTLSSNRSSASASMSDLVTVLLNCDQWSVSSTDLSWSVLSFLLVPHFVSKLKKKSDVLSTSNETAWDAWKMWMHDCSCSLVAFYGLHIGCMEKGTEKWSRFSTLRFDTLYWQTATCQK
jgi:hypothetical protein